jgi:hypothetical protein
MKRAFARAALIFVVVHAIAAFFFLLLGVGCRRHRGGEEGNTGRLLLSTKINSGIGRRLPLPSSGNLQRSLEPQIENDRDDHMVMRKFRN